MKIIHFSLVFLLSLFYVGTGRAQDTRVEKFEKDFAHKVLSFPNDTTGLHSFLLLGYKSSATIESEQEQEHIKSLSENKFPTSNHLYFAEDLSYYRLYFHLRDAIVDDGNKKYRANEKGIVLLDDSAAASEIKLADTTQSKKAASFYEDNRIVVFDLGTPGH